MNVNALRKIGYGMYVIGSFLGERKNAQIANTVFQISSEPPTLAVSINKNNLTHEFIKASRVFSAAVLAESTPLSFIGGLGFKSGRDTDKFKEIKHKTGQTGAPVVLDNTNAYFEVKITQEVDAGTHTVFIGNLVASEVINEDPAMSYDFYQRVKRGTTPKSAPSYIAK